MPIYALATIEVQLCMRMLDTQSLLRLARCSRRMYADASSVFAWGTQNVVVNGTDNILRAARSLLHHSSNVLLQFGADDPPLSDDPTTAISQFSRVSTLFVQIVDGLSHAAEQILKAPLGAVRGLTVFARAQSIETWLQQTTQAWPSLERLDIDANEFPPLPLFARVHELSITPPRFATLNFANFPVLEHLIINGGGAIESLPPDYLTRGLECITSLTLQWIQPGYAIGRHLQWDGVWTYLPALQNLRFIHCNDTDRLIALLAAGPSLLPALRTLTAVMMPYHCELARIKSELATIRKQRPGLNARLEERMY
jgi:hypothetical protein